MATLKRAIGDFIGRIIFNEIVVTRAREVSPHFRLLALQGDSLRAARVNPGDKVQVMIPDTGPRTYTPFAFDAAKGEIQFLVYSHGDSPGARWGKEVRVGDAVRAFGPRGSLALSSLQGPVVLFGDETSFAVARALHDHRGGGRDVELVFEVSSRDESERVLDDLGLPRRRVIEKTPGESHLGEVTRALREALTRPGKVELVLTGKAQSIQVLRKALRDQPAGSTWRQSVKPYWSVGKTGLD